MACIILPIIPKPCMVCVFKNILDQTVYVLVNL